MVNTELMYHNSTGSRSSFLNRSFTSVSTSLNDCQTRCIFGNWPCVWTNVAGSVALMGGVQEKAPTPSIMQLVLADVLVRSKIR